MNARFSTRLLLAFAAFAALGCLAAHAQSIYLCLGSSSTNLTPALYATCAGHGTTQNASQISTLSFGVISNAPGTGSVKTQMSSLTLQKAVDDTSVALAKDLFLGTAVKTLAIGIVAPSANGSGLSNITIILTNAHVTLVENGGSGGAGPMFEAVSFTFQKIEVVDNTTSPPTKTIWGS